MKKRAPIYIFIIVCCAWVGVLFHNIINNARFMEVSAGVMLQSGIVLIVSYFLVQYRSDVKQRLQLTEDFLTKIVEAYTVFNENALRWVDSQIEDVNDQKETWQKINTYGRRISNYLSLLKKMPLQKEDKNILLNIEEEWGHVLDKCTSAVNNDPEKVEISRNLERFKLLIDEKTDNIMMHLYI